MVVVVVAVVAAAAASAEEFTVSTGWVGNNEQAAGDVVDGACEQSGGGVVDGACGGASLHRQHLS